MALTRWFPPEPEPIEGGLISFRRQLLLALSIFAFYGAWLLLLWVPDSRTVAVRDLRVVGIGTVLAAVTFVLRQNWPRLASWIYVLAALGWLGAACVTFGQPVIPAALMLVVLAAGLLLGALPCVLVGSLAGALVFMLGRVGVLGGMGPFWLALLFTVTVTGVLVSHVVELAGFWERETTGRQMSLIEQLRDRQYELNRALKELDQAYASLRRSNEELKIARQAAEEARVVKEQFVANVSHELRTPLNLIVGFAEIMYLSPESYDGVGWTPDLESDIREMYRASRHLQSLIDDILDLSRIDAARLPMFRELLDLRSVVSDALETMSPLLKQHHLTLTTHWPDALPQLFIDRTRIRQVMLNLLNNAVRFTDQGGITVEIEQTEEAVHLSVRDTGVGIAPAQLAHIFEEFRQADPGPRSRGGAGLGLTISQRFIEMHGGRMWAESEPGAGSTFHFALSLPGAVAQTVGFQLVEGRVHVEQTAPVLVVDPDPNIASMLSRYLGDHRLVMAADLVEAFATVEAQHPLAVIVNLPPDAPTQGWLGGAGSGSTGASVASAAALNTLSERYNIPVLRCSLPSGSWLQGGSSGIDECLTKPVLRSALKQVLEKHCPQGGSLLMVDDDPAFISLMTRMVRILRKDVRVRTAYRGRQALRLARQHAPDLVLLDLLMPEMDGFQVLRALRENLHLTRVCVVAVTATSYAEERLRRTGGFFTVTQSGGLSSGAVTEMLRVTLQNVRPNYSVEEKTPEIA
jgi:signal transduction histidine kinase/CheY-like chemotaxis protein